MGNLTEKEIDIPKELAELKVLSKDGNYLLAGKGNTSAFVGNRLWHNYTIKLRISLLSDNSSSQVSFRHSDLTGDR